MMKSLALLSLICVLFFKSAAWRIPGRDYVWQRRTCAEDLAKAEGCESEMRRFGPNNQYRCNCKNISSCDFQNKGLCQDNICSSGFRGSYCQRIIYKIRPRKYAKRCGVHLNYKPRINYLEIYCLYPGNIAGNIAGNITVYNGSQKYCEIPCRGGATCTGDAIIETIFLNVTGDIYNVYARGCMPLWFGIDCDKQCHCENNAECNMLTGSCPLRCENGWSGPDCQNANFENVALNKTARQSSTQSNGLVFDNGTCQMRTISFSADLAVDGNTDQQVERLSCMQTQRQKEPFWEVDLGEKYNISQIRIYNMNSLKTFYDRRISVFVDGQFCNNIPFITPTALSVSDITCTSILSGTSVRISHDGYTSLHICEVEVLQCLPGYYGYRCSKNCSECQKAPCHQLTGQCHGSPAYSNHTNGIKKSLSLGTSLIIGLSMLLIVNVLGFVFCFMWKKSQTKRDAQSENKPTSLCVEMKAKSADDVECAAAEDVANDENLYDSLSDCSPEDANIKIYSNKESLYENAAFPPRP